MTSQFRLPIFVDCPYGGCEDGYCACLERALDEDDFDGPYEDLDPDDEPESFRAVETVLISIDDYESPKEP